MIKLATWSAEASRNSTRKAITPDTGGEREQAASNAGGRPRDDQHHREHEQVEQGSVASLQGVAGDPAHAIERYDHAT